jgi:hypothetical protein
VPLGEFLHTFVPKNVLETGKHEYREKQEEFDMTHLPFCFPHHVYYMREKKIRKKEENMTK